MTRKKQSRDGKRFVIASESEAIQALLLQYKKYTERDLSLRARAKQFRLYCSNIKNIRKEICHCERERSNPGFIAPI